MISVIIPTYNEETPIAGLVRRLPAQPVEKEIIVADGSSTDGTLRRLPGGVRVVVTERNRGRQLNSAARQARGGTLCFLHADAYVPEGALAAVERALDSPSVIGGTFSLAFDGPSLAAWVLTRINRWRRRLGVFYGDQGVFVRREVFERLGGFREWPLMEDYEFGHRLVRAGRTVCLPETLRVSIRRWRPGGGRRRLLRTLASWFFIQMGYHLGVPVERLAHWYLPVRDTRER